eukprot:CAMPEP_0181318892 /NCGR_PEP_ID=MMETSP1101-20121128/17257_1 /TAXON_ID=46948 /ORGANISM="Rhodomonas abbreviata, Strain Caron Lab Isolate" /LENGTH=44 /DNA_ID= /DNA_START= /DNA_END= /DNA_ORIENTATION=
MAELLDAAKNGKINVVRRLLRAGADINYQNRLGTTALHWASLRG